MSEVFNDLTISERIRLLSEKYDKAGGCDAHRRARERDLIGREYGMTGRNLARYIRCNQLIPAFKDMLDDGTLSLTAGVEVSFLSEKEQAIVFDVLEQNCISLDKDAAVRLRSATGNVTRDFVQAVFGVDKPVDTDKPVSVKLPAVIYSRYFANVAAGDVQGIVEEALCQYFERKGA